MRYHSRITKMTKVQKMVFIAMLVSMALVLSFFERYIPVQLWFPIPGVKLGLANIITLTSLFFLTFTEAFFLVIIRVLLGSLVLGNFSAFLYSLAGGLLSFLVMYFMVHITGELFSVIITSVIGGIFHNVGQLIMASIIIQRNLIYWLPHLFVAGIITGILVGIAVKYLLEYVKKMVT